MQHLKKEIRLKLLILAPDSTDLCQVAHFPIFCDLHL